MEIRMESTKRPVIKARLLGAERFFLLDTGASVGMIDSRVKGLHPSHRKVDIVDASGDEMSLPVLNDFVTAGGRTLGQFLLTDLKGVRDSIARETGLRIDGIIGYAQMKSLGIVIDTDKNVITIR